MRRIGGGELARIARFAISGVVATAIHVAVLLSLAHFFSMPLWLANGLAFCCATTWSYAANTLWTFGTKPTANNLGRFLTVTVSLALFSGVLGGIADILMWPAIAPAIMSVICLPPLTYLLHARWSYR